MAEVLPWQQAVWDRLQQQIQQQRVPHALLLHGPAGIGKLQFASTLAHALLCDSPLPGGYACGRCSGCKLLAAGTHPDLIGLEPEEGKQVLAVDRVREMITNFAYTPQIARRKVLQLHPAESMNPSAANSLLKTLEEPPGEAVMILVSHAPARLLPTIRSRCQQLPFVLPSTDQGMRWLQQQGGVEDAAAVLALAEGVPLKALALSQPELLEHNRLMGQELIDLLAGRADAIRVARRWSDKSLDAATTLLWLQQWSSALIKGQVEREPLTTLSRALQALPQQRLFLFYDKVSQARSLLTTSVNRELLFEGILLEWCSFR